MTKLLEVVIETRKQEFLDLLRTDQACLFSHSRDPQESNQTPKSCLIAIRSETHIFDTARSREGKSWLPCSGSGI